MIYICERCGYSSTLKSNLKRHLMKQTHCKSTSSCLKAPIQLLNELYHEDKQYSCECGKKYRHRSHLYRHQKSCHKYIQQKEFEEMKKMIELLKHQTEAKNNTQSITANGDHNTNNITNNNIVNHNTIIVNNFGNEDISYLSPEFIEKCTCYLSLGIKSMAKAIHLNKNHPENHTMKVTNVKSPYIPVIQDKKWIMKDKKDVLKFLIEKIADILKSHFDDNKDGIKEKYNSYKRDAIEMYHERLEKEDKELWNKIMKDVYLMFANDKEIFPKTRKKKEKVSTG